MTTYLVFGIKAALLSLIWMPLLVSFDTMFPHVLGKALFARSAIEFILFLWIILITIDPNYRPRKSWIFLAIIAYITIGFLSAISGVSFGMSIWSNFNRMWGLWDQLHWFALIIVLSTIFKDLDSWKPFFIWNLVVALGIGLLALSQAFNMSPSHSRYANCSLDSTLGNPSYLSQLMIMNIFIAAGLFIQSIQKVKESQTESAVNESPPNNSRKNRKKNRKASGISNPMSYNFIELGFYVFTLTILLWVFFLAASRGGLLGLVLGTLIATPIFIRFIDRSQIKMVLTTGVGILGITAVFFTFDATIGLPIDQSCRIQSSLDGDLLCETSDSSVDCTRSLPEPYVDALFKTEPPAPEPETPTLASEQSEDVLESLLGMRYAFLGMAIKGVQEKPLLGWGPENFGRVFDKYSDIGYYKHGFIVADNAHNAPINELAERGILGFIVFILLWFTLFWRLLSNRSEGSHETFRFIVFAALIGYFITTLFLFATPAGLLLWAILGGWIASQDNKENNPLNLIGAQWFEKPKNLSGIVISKINYSFRITFIVILGATILLTSLYQTAYRPYKGGEAYKIARQAEDVTVEERLMLVNFSHQAFPQMSRITRQEFLEHLAKTWSYFNLEEQNLVANFIYHETRWVIKHSPENSRMIQAAYSIPQVIANEQQLEDLHAVLDKMIELAPYRATTHLFLANQALLEGNFQEALDISNSFASQATNMLVLFEPIIDEAKLQLEESSKNQ